MVEKLKSARKYKQRPACDGTQMTRIILIYTDLGFSDHKYSPIVWYGTEGPFYQSKSVSTASSVFQIKVPPI